jgi:putative aminopeptidase FrvX
LRIDAVPDWKLQMFKKLLWFFSPVLLLIFAVRAPAQSSQYIRLEQEVIQNRLKQYSDQNSKREAAVKQMFKEAGCGGEQLSEQPVPETAAPNVICTLPGEGNEAIIIGAHFDHVHNGDGVVDNWSGASLLPSLFQSLRFTPRKHTFVFISFTDEEKGMVGSDFYAKHLTKKESAHIQAMVDIDTLGLGPTEVWVSNSDPKLVSLMSNVAAAMKLPLRGMDVDQVGDSDGRSFKRRDIPIITLHSVTQDTLSILHSSKDNLSAIKFSDYYDSYKLIAAYLVALDSSLASH